MHFSPPAALGLWFGMAAVAQAAQENPIDFNIPAQPLAAALDAFSKQSGVNLFYADGILQGKRSAGLQGVYRPAEALDRLLAGTGIGYTFTGGNTAALKANAPAGAKAGDTLPPATVQGEAAFDATDPYNTTYTVVNSSTAFKTDTPLIETPVSVQVVPRTVMNDQKSVRIKDALENVSGVRAQLTLGMGTGFIVRGFRQDQVFRNGLLTTQ